MGRFVIGDSAEPKRPPRAGPRTEAGLGSQVFSKMLASRRRIAHRDSCRPTSMASRRPSQQMPSYEHGPSRALVTGAELFRSPKQEPPGNTNG